MFEVFRQDSLVSDGFITMDNIIKAGISHNNNSVINRNSK